MPREQASKHAREPARPDRDRDMPCRRKILWASLFLLIGLGAAIYLHWPALTDPLVYKSDVRQGPHWAAYHTDTFRDDDLILTLASHNKSPVWNLIYYLGTFAVDMVTLGKLIAVLSYGLTAALFFWIGHSLYGLPAGALVAISFTFFPDQFEYSAGGFAKCTMIPMILVCVYLLEKRAWRGLLLLMPLGAITYPVSAVLIGAVALTFILLEAPEKGRRMLPAIAYLGAASGLALALLLAKYLFPPDGIGTLTPGSVLREMPEMYAGGLYHYLPLPTLTEEMTRRLAHPFILLSGGVFLSCLHRKGLAWSRPLTALLVASMVMYLLADHFFMNLYQPNRYTRYSMAVLLAIWHGRNWARVLDLVPWRMAQALALVALLGLGGYLHRDTFRMGKDTGPRHEWAPLNRFIATLPPKVLVAGPPKYMDDIPIQARRSVLCNYKLAHPWYSEYYAEIRRRTLATFDALYAAEPGPVNRLYREWGVTHLVVVRDQMSRARIWDMDIYVEPFDSYILKMLPISQQLLLTHPPSDRVVYEDDELFVVALPLS